MMTVRAQGSFVGIVLAGLVACRAAPPASAPLFESLAPSATGVTFVNRLPEDSSFNVLTYLYYYNGGGVAVGDINNDGLPDLYFTSNIGPNRLYLNKGNYHFEDVTERAGVADSIGWKTGVTTADVNGDGYVDIYVSAVDYLTMHGRNALYVNNRDGTFTDRTKEYGLDHVGYSTQALFFDYDGDGYLDMFLLNHSTHGERSSNASSEPGGPRGSDRLFRNDHGHFVDVSERAGVADHAGAFGLGVVASDFNLDGCPDLYVANDFQENDYLYINNCNGSFTESIARATGHTSRFSMGVDAADFNNDGRPDLIVTDMLPDREDILKSSASTESVDLFDRQSRAGYHPQYERNTLQLSRGPSLRPAQVPLFSDIGFLAGVAATDWSWSPLFADLDNDGNKDLFITNGVYRRPNDLDYISYISNDAVQASLAGGITRENATVIKKMPQMPEPNFAFRNNGDLTFTNMAAAWGLAQPGFSNGAVYVDLNNSGALDLVVNNINAAASIYRNRLRELNPGESHYLGVQLRGARGNTAGVGAKVTIFAGGKMQLLEQMPTRGFESSVDPRLHFGLGTATRVDSLIVIWPSRKESVLRNVQGDQLLTVREADAVEKPFASSHSSLAVRRPLVTLFTDITATTKLDFKHEENDFSDFNREPLIPHLLSAEGPALAVGDVNGDGLDDIYIGGAKWQAGRLYLQQPDGTFRASLQPAFQVDSLQEDVDAVFFDANGDGHLDLYVVSGGNEFWGEDDALQDRLYINDGNGNFRRDTQALPRFAESGSCVVAGDFNGDGHVDLFVGRRAVARNYGQIPRSYLLENDGNGHFTDVTNEKAPALADAGMVTSATWIDYDNDGKLDLVVVGEWMPVRVFHQENGKLVDRTSAAGLAGTEGWWNTITAVDVNGDGRKDLVLGNLGLNSYLRASAKEPTRLYAGDFYSTGALKQILTTYKHGVSYPLAQRDELLQMMPQLRTKFPTYSAFGASRVEDILPASELSKAKVLEAHDFASAIAVNDGKGTFTLRDLPIEAQFAPVNATLAADIDGDGHLDLLIAGNSYGEPPMLGRYDASYGLLLRGTGDGRFAPADMAATNLVIQGQVRHLALLRGPHGAKLIAVARNNDTLEILQVKQ
jgi:hypothetical protein